VANIKEVTIKINVDTGEVVDAGKDFNNLNKSVTKGTKEMTTSMGGLKTSLLGVGAALGGLAALKAVVGDAAQRILAFEKSISSLSAITGAVGKDLDKLKGNVLSVASSTKKSATEIAKAFELVGSAQPQLLENADALALVTENAITLSKASGLDLTAAVNATTTGLAQFNIAASDSQQVIDALAAGAKFGASAIPETTAAIEKFGAVANASNVTIQDSVALVETLATKQLTGAEAGNNLKNIILKLKNEGVGFVDGQFNINAALEETKERFEGIADPVERSKAQTKLFGLESVTAGQVLLDNIGTFEDFQSKVGEAGVAMTQAVIQTDNLASKTEALDATYESFILSLEDGNGVISDLAKGVVDYFTNVLSGLTEINNFDFDSIFKADSTRAFGDAALDLGNTFLSLTNPAVAESVELMRDGLNKTLDETTNKFKTLSAEQLANKDNANTIVQTYVKLGFSAGEARDKYVELVAAQNSQTEASEENKTASEEETTALDESTTALDGNNKAREKQLSFFDRLKEKVSETKKKLEEAEILDRIYTDDTSGDEEEDEDFEEFLAAEGLSDEDLEKRKEALEEKQLQDEEAAQIKFDSKLEQNELELEQEQASADLKKQLNQEIAFSALGLASAIAQAAGDSQQAQLAALAFEKIAALASIVVNTQVALSNPLVAVNPVLTAKVIAGGAIQAATVLATALPQVKNITKPKEPKKLKDGEVMIDGAGTETSDSIPAMLSKNESVINAKSTKKHTAALRAINDDRFEEYLNRVVMQRLYTGGRDAKDIKISTKKESINFPSRLNVGNARAISKPIVDAIEDSNFLKGAGWD
jgi:TP901 family phage tail tape measure protein